MVRIAIVDDSEVFYEGLVLNLQRQAHIEVLPPIVSYEDALALLPQFSMDLVLVDMRLPYHRPQPDQVFRHATASWGLRLLRYIAEQWPRILTIAMSSVVEDGLVIQAYLAGARGFLDKNSHASLFVQVVESVLQGEFAFSPYHWRLIEERRALYLTPREEQVLELLCEGLTNREIAKRLGIQEGTVRKYVESLRAKFHARTRGQVCAKARRLGFLYVIE